MPKTIYKIYNSELQLWSNGGTYLVNNRDKGSYNKSSWSKNGKFWNSVSSIKNHLNQYAKSDIPKTWIIYEYYVGDCRVYS